MGHISANIRSVKEDILRAAEKVGRDPDHITLMAVTKGVSPDGIKEAMEEGIADFGENRVQEASEKITYFSGSRDIRWHMIGHLQTNKARTAVSLFNKIHSVDTLKLAAKINDAALESKKIIPVYIELNISGEQSKYGARPSDLNVLLEKMREMPALSLEGFMTMAPFSEDPQNSRGYFREMSVLAKYHGLKGLCMGMSQDFIVAIEEGATIIRVGRAIFGERPAQKGGKI